MSFPKKLPKAVAEAGQLIARFRAEDPCNAFDQREKGERFLYVVAENEHFFSVFEGERRLCMGKLPYGKSTFKLRVWCNKHRAQWRDNFLDNINQVLERWTNHLQLNIVEGNIGTGNGAGKAFAICFMTWHPELANVVRDGLGLTLLDGNGMPFTPVKEPAPKPTRIILSRTEWMARHYPQRAAA